MFGLSSAHAAWRVDNSESMFNFVTAKAPAQGVAAIVEAQRFKQIDGTVRDDGKLEFDVDLGSVETSNPLRNERVKEILFKVAGNPNAVFAGTVDARRFGAMRVGASADVDVNGQLTINGQSNPLTATLRIVKLESGALQVLTSVPIVGPRTVARQPTSIVRAAYEVDKNYYRVILNSAGLHSFALSSQLIVRQSTIALRGQQLKVSRA
ncbi:YceI family protein [Paraburkholderia sp. FT54]|nr:YceI family protein [Paraburkholderia sp. FT54]WNC95102.1 YceI family protein [Paraburkholderia sp. FT54]